jgi:hypothetical protein
LLLLVGAALFLAPPAEAATLTGTFTYQDSNGIRPIASAKVEIWHIGVFFWNTWAKVAEVRTDSDGRLTYQDARCDGTYGVRVFASNFGAVVHDFAFNNSSAPFYREPGWPGPNINFPVSSCSDGPISVSWRFPDSFASFHYNIADAIRHGATYASAPSRRAFGETDPINPVMVYFTDQASHYNPVNNSLNINGSQVLNDKLILHEYAHFLEAAISSFAWIGSDHNGCVATLIVSTGGDWFQHAWMEGFADYFSETVPNFLVAGTLELTGSGQGFNIESPGQCSFRSPAETEQFVAASLWDVFDAPGVVEETHDSLSGNDATIMQIFDRELDTGAWPTIFDFHNAWVARGLDHLGLDWTLHQHGIYPHGPAPCRPLTVPLKLYWSSARGDNYTTATAAGEASAIAAGYQFARNEGCVLTSPDSASRAPLKLFWSGARGDNYTTATAAGESAARGASYQFVRNEGFVFTGAASGRVPLDTFWSWVREDHFTTGTQAGALDARAAGYTFVGTEGFVFPN